MEWSLGGPLSELCLLTWTFIQDVHFLVVKFVDPHTDHTCQIVNFSMLCLYMYQVCRLLSVFLWWIFIRTRHRDADAL